MKHKAIVLGAALLAAALAASAALAGTTGGNARRSDNLVGAGSSLVAPLISQWIPDYGVKTGVTVTYGSIGSGGGIAAITNRTVDFGASDAPLTPDQFKACNGCVQIPWALSATTVSYNVKGAPNDLHLNGPVIASIFLGKLKYWDDPAIQSLNPKVKLPHEAITPVFRSDGSGDTFAFTDYLSKVSPEWRAKVGNATQVNFPTGIGGKGNSGVSGVITRTEGAVGYISVAYTLQNHLTIAAIKNASGAWALPGIRGIAAAASLVTKVPAQNRMSIVDPPKGNRLAYPISTFTYVILPTRTPKAAALRRFVFYGLTQGQAFGKKLVFAPIPKIVLVAAERTLKEIRS